MTDNFNELETGASCYVLNNASTIYSYKGSVRKTYIQVGGKWYYTTQSTYNTIPSGAVCFSYSDITKLNSNAVFEPFLIGLSFCLAVFVWWAVFSLFSRLVRWRV